MAYDPKSYELAEHFMKDEETDTETEYKLLVDSLATAIQEAIEIWFKQQEDKSESSSEPPQTHGA